jgi:hypothetical protein
MLALGEYRRGAWRPWTVAPRSDEDDLEEGAYDRTPEEEPEELERDVIPDLCPSFLAGAWVRPDGDLSIDRDPAEDLSTDLEPIEDLGFEVTRPPGERVPGETVRRESLRPMDPVDRSPAEDLPTDRDGEPSDDLSSVRSKDRICGRAPPRELTPLSPLRLTTGLTSGCREAKLICPRRDACWRLSATWEMCRS